jgi:Domain of unknown function (DUF4440)
VGVAVSAPSAAKDDQVGKLRTLSPEERQAVLAVRESAWRAFFAGDAAMLKKILPAEFIGMSEGTSEWQNLATVLERSKGFAAGGGKLIRLEFPKTEIQAYGATAIIYTTYLYEVETQGKRNVSQGRATKMFVFRDKQWLHNGWHLEAMK